MSNTTLQRALDALADLAIISHECRVNPGMMAETKMRDRFWKASEAVDDYMGNAILDRIGAKVGATNETDK